MKHFLNAALGLTVALASVFAPLQAGAQQRYGDQQQTMLVTPDGRVLDFMPERGDIVISRDTMGRTVFYDRYGNLLATEMPSGYQQRQQQDTTYYPPAPGGQYREPQRDYGYQDNGSVRDYREYRGDGADDNVYTGSVPAPARLKAGHLASRCRAKAPRPPFRSRST